MTPEEYVGKWECEAGREGMLSDLRAMLREERIRALEWVRGDLEGYILPYECLRPQDATFVIDRHIDKEREAQGG